MTRKEVKEALKETEERIRSAAGLELFRLEEERETLKQILLGK